MTAAPLIALDKETYPIKPGLLAPRGVCLSWAEPGPDPAGPIKVGLALRDDGLPILRGWLESDAILTAHNAPFDFGVAVADDSSLLPLVFRAYLDGRVQCTITRQKVLDVAMGMRKWRRANGRVSRATYGLNDLVALYFNGEHLEKDDTWRLRYGLLDGVPVEQWPPEARDYAIGDAVHGRRVYLAQSAAMVEYFGGELPNQAEQQRAAWALHLMSMWGLRADPTAVDHFLGECEEAIDKMEAALEETAILKRSKRTDELSRNPNGTAQRSMKEIQRRVEASMLKLGMQVPRTDPSSKFPDGQVKTDEDTLRLTDDPALHVLADSMTFVKHLGQWGPVVRAAVLRPICVRYNELVDNGRTSASGSEGQESTNIQNPPRKGEVRPCFRARPGWVLVSTDADTIELRALAQCCLEMVGYSRMAEVLRKQHAEKGPDLHVTLAAGVANIPLAEAHRLHLADDLDFANVRQLSKHGNFAFGGFAGAFRFVGMAHDFGVVLARSFPTAMEARAMAEDLRHARRIDSTEVCPVFREAERPDGTHYVETVWTVFEEEFAAAQRLREVWMRTWPEMREYFRIVRELVDRGKRMVHPMSNRIRYVDRLPAAANSFFSGRVADAEKEILFALAWECYVGSCYFCRGRGCERCAGTGQSPLVGSRPVMFLHDEPILEHPHDGSLPERMGRQRDVVVWILGKWMPGVPCTSTAVAMVNWQKGAKPLKDDPYAPVKPVKVRDEKSGKWKTKWIKDEGNGVRKK